jgi:hypothetical protein
VLQNSDNSPLNTAQIAAHLQVNPWNVTRELQLGRRQTNSGRLRGDKKTGTGLVGSGGQWRVDRQTYLNWLQVLLADRDHVGPDGLPELIPLTHAARQLDLSRENLGTLIRRQRWPHITFGRNRYLTRNQLERIRVQINKDCREATPGGSDPDAPVT